jgi:hypothetical protein
VGDTEPLKERPFAEDIEIVGVRVIARTIDLPVVAQLKKAVRRHATFCVFVDADPALLEIVRVDDFGVEDDEQNEGRKTQDGEERSERSSVSE